MNKLETICDHDQCGKCKLDGSKCHLSWWRISSNSSYWKRCYKTDKTADFSPCRKYRYSLFRWWDKSKPFVLFIGLNPSTADETTDDPTIRRCVGFAKQWGFGGVCMANIFAYRATDPAEMKRQSDPVGPGNDAWLKKLASEANEVVVAWGVHGVHEDRDQEVKLLISSMMCLGKTNGGHPKHPLYLRKDTERQVF